MLFVLMVKLLLYLQEEVFPQAKKYGELCQSWLLALCVKVGQIYEGHLPFHTQMKPIVQWLLFLVSLPLVFMALNKSVYC